jgi:hypothetical protein
MSKPRPFTVAEERKRFLAQCRANARYWAALPNKTPQERCDGVTFSLLAMLDGTTPSIPMIELVLRPHPDDKAYCIGKGENWHKPGLAITDSPRELHDEYYNPT